MKSSEFVLSLLIAVAVLVTVARRLRVAYPIFLVLGGLAIGVVPGLPRPQVDSELIYLLVLPPIVYSASVFTPLRTLRANLANVASLAIGLVIASALVVAAIAHTLVSGMSWPIAFVLGAITSPSDEVAVTQVAAQLAVPRRVLAVIEAESLLNDATGVTLYRVALLAVVAGSFSFAFAVGTFFVSSVGGIAVGFVIGWLAVQVRRRINDTPVEITLALLTPYAAFLPAQALNVSGVIATVVAGMYVGSRFSQITKCRLPLGGSRNVGYGRLPAQRLRVHPDRARGAIRPRPRRDFRYRQTHRRRRRYDPRSHCSSRDLDLHLGVPAAPPEAKRVRTIEVGGLGCRDLGWDARRHLAGHSPGSAQTLANGAPFPARAELLVVTLTVIVLTLVGQGLTLPWVIRRAHLGADTEVVDEEAAARRRLVDAAVSRIDELYPVWPGHHPLLDQMRETYRHRSEHAERQRDRSPDAANQELIEHREIKRTVADAEREALLRVRADGDIDDDVVRKLERELDLEEQRGEA